MIDTEVLQQRIKQLNEALEDAQTDCKKAYWFYKNTKDNMISYQQFYNQQKDNLNDKGIKEGKEQIKNFREASKIAYDSYLQLVKRVSFIEGGIETLSLLLEDHLGIIQDVA